MAIPLPPQTATVDSLSSSSTLISPLADPKDLVTLVRRSRCQPDLFDPSIECTVKDIDDDRQCVSHFFGRNKQGTASVPSDYFPVLCRKHYQERYYRWSDDPGLYASYQCDNILQVLDRMQARSFRDANGLDWPWYCGVELRLSHQYQQKSQTRDVPSWLHQMCSLPLNHAEFDSSPDDQCEARYSLAQLVQIVKGIKTWCIEYNEHLPCIEALPVTIGMHDRQTLATAKKALKLAEGKRNLAYSMHQRLQRSGNNSLIPKHQSPSKLQILIEEAEVALEVVNSAKMDAAATVATVPLKRQSRRRLGDIAHKQHPASSNLSVAGKDVEGCHN